MTPHFENEGYQIWDKQQSESDKTTFILRRPCLCPEALGFTPLQCSLQGVHVSSCSLTREALFSSNLKLHRVLKITVDIVCSECKLFHLVGGENRGNIAPLATMWIPHNCKSLLCKLIFLCLTTESAHNIPSSARESVNISPLRYWDVYPFTNK